VGEATHRAFLRREVAVVLYEKLRKKVGTTTEENAASHADSIAVFERLYELYDKFLSNEKVRFLTEGIECF
jgi:hypothetical protein